MCSRRHATVSVLQRVLRYGFPFAPCTYAAFKSALVRAPTPRGESGPDRAARPRPRRHRSYDTCSVHCLTLAEYKTPTTPRRHTTARINITGVPALAGGGLLPSEREARARPRRSTAEHDAATTRRDTLCCALQLVGGPFPATAPGILRAYLVRTLASRGLTPRDQGPGPSARWSRCCPRR